MPSGILQTLKLIFSPFLRIFWVNIWLFIYKTFFSKLFNYYLLGILKKIESCSSKLNPRLHLGRQVSKNEINKSKPWSPMQILFLHVL
jgi:hypothetical protein